jgi:hypothetical protein
VSAFAPDKKKIDAEFVEHVEDMIAKGYDSIVSVENVKRAHALLEFFNKNKMILSGYHHEDWSSDFKEILISLFKAKPVVTLEQQIIKYILLSEKPKVKSNEVNQRFTAANANFVKTIFEKLSDLNIGKTFSDSNERGKASLYFEKRETALAIKDMVFVNVIESVGINIAEYIEANRTTERELIILLNMAIL